MTRLVTLLAGLFFWPCLTQAAVVAEPLMTLQANLQQPTDVAVRDDGRVYVLDGVNGRVVVFTREGERDFSFSRPGSEPGELSLPVGIAIDAERVFVADTGNPPHCRVRCAWWLYTQYFPDRRGTA